MFAKHFPSLYCCELWQWPSNQLVDYLLPQVCAYAVILLDENSKMNASAASFCTEMSLLKSAEASLEAFKK